MKNKWTSRLHIHNHNYAQIYQDDLGEEIVGFIIHKLSLRGNNKFWALTFITIEDYNIFKGVLIVIKQFYNFSYLYEPFYKLTLVIWKLLSLTHWFEQIVD